MTPLNTWSPLEEADTFLVSMKPLLAGGLTLRYMSLDGKGQFFTLSIDAVEALKKALQADTVPLAPLAHAEPSGNGIGYQPTHDVPQEPLLSEAEVKALWAPAAGTVLESCLTLGAVHGRPVIEGEVLEMLQRLGIPPQAPAQAYIDELARLAAGPWEREGHHA